MKLLELDRLEIKPIERLGRVFPKGEMTLVFGLPGSGKTVSTLRELNKDGIKPIFFNLDHSVVDEDIETEMFDEKVLQYLFTEDIEDIRGSVVVIDTYTRLEPILQDLYYNQTGKKPSDLAIFKMLDYIRTKYDLTLIIIGHSVDYVGKDGIFKDNEIIIRNCFEYIYVDRKESSSTKKGKDDKKVTTITTTRYAKVGKGRGYSGDFILSDFGSNTL